MAFYWIEKGIEVQNLSCIVAGGVFYHRRQQFDRGMALLMEGALMGSAFARLQLAVIYDGQRNLKLSFPEKIPFILDCPPRFSVNAHMAKVFYEKIKFSTHHKFEESRWWGVTGPEFAKFVERRLKQLS